MGKQYSWLKSERVVKGVADEIFHFPGSSKLILTELADTENIDTLVTHMVKNLPAMQETQVQSQCLEDPLAQSCPTLSDPLGLQPSRPLGPWDFPGKSTGVRIMS